MRNRLVGSTMAAAGIAAFLGFSPLLSAQAPAAPAQARPLPRTADGKPNLSGIWQVMNTAAWDIQDHSAQKGVPGGQGVVEGNEIPYQPAALAKKKENYRQSRDRRPREQVLSARRPASDVHAVSVSDFPDAHLHGVCLRVCPRRAACLHERDAASPWSDRMVAGRLARPLGRGHPGRRRGALHRSDMVRQGRELPQRGPASRRALHDDRRPTISTTRSRSRIRRCSRGRGRCA